MSQHKWVIGLIGGNQGTVYLQALEGIPEIKIAGIVPSQIRDDAIYKGRQYVDGDSLFEDKEINAVLVISPPEEHKYWFQCAFEAGKHIITPTLSGQRYAQVKCLSKQFIANDLRWFILRDSLVSAWRRYYAGLGESFDPTLYFDLELSIPYKWLQRVKEGILSTYSLGALNIITSPWGKIDSIYAYTRSYLLNKSQEDMVHAQIKFYNGVEGVVRLNALGEKAELRLNIWGNKTHQVFEHKLMRDFEIKDVKEQFKDMIFNVQKNELQDNNIGQLGALRLSEWIQKSARVNREIYASEIGQ